MNKEIFRFLIWQIKRIDAWQFSMVGVMTLIALSFIGPPATRPYFLLSQLIINVIIALKLLVWEPLKRNWQIYKKERYKVFELLKEDYDEHTD